MSKDELGDRMKSYEVVEAGRRLMPLLPICIRIDGKRFSKWTNDLERPYDIRLQKIMIELTKFLVKETNAVIGYTQSDEISLILYSPDRASTVFFDGKIQKINSVLASFATGKFNQLASKEFHNKPIAYFDCRVWNVPNLQEAANVLLWREQDAAKNSVSMAARCYYSHLECDGKNSSQLQEMLYKKGINWNDYPASFKRGTFIQRTKIFSKFTEDEIIKLPDNHQAKNNPDFIIERRIIQQVDMPIFSTVTNKVDVIFEGRLPVVKTS